MCNMSCFTKETRVCAASSCVLADKEECLEDFCSSKNKEKEGREQETHFFPIFSVQLQIKLEELGLCFFEKTAKIVLREGRENQKSGILLLVLLFNLQSFVCENSKCDTCKCACKDTQNQERNKCVHQSLQLILCRKRRSQPVHS